MPDAPELRERAYPPNRRRWRTSTVTFRRWPMPSRRAAATSSSQTMARTSSAISGTWRGGMGAKIITKSKSMATEEIELNRRLEEDYDDLGLEIVETDLGEWIAQLAGDTPSHIVGPILHMNKERITEILSGVSDEDLPPGRGVPGRLRPQASQGEIRERGHRHYGRQLRGRRDGHYLHRHQRGGNARLVTSVPPVHVVVMGIEKVIPKFEDLSTFVQLLSRSGTGQKITVYTNFITGPRGEGELDGAEEFHLILMDNGRSKLLGTEYEEALYCIRCGSC